jgi:hypothetical protein
VLRTDRSVAIDVYDSCHRKPAGLPAPDCAGRHSRCFRPQICPRICWVGKEAAHFGLRQIAIVGEWASHWGGGTPRNVDASTIADWSAPVGRGPRDRLLVAALGRSTSRSAATAVVARSDGPVETPNTQCTHAPATIANGKRRIAHDGHRGRNVPAATPRRITADSAPVLRCTSSRRASSALLPRRDPSSDRSDPATSTILQMASTVSPSTVSGSRSACVERSSDRSCESTRPSSRDRDGDVDLCRMSRTSFRPSLSATRMDGLSIVRNRVSIDAGNEVVTVSVLTVRGEGSRGARARGCDT